MIVTVKRDNITDKCCFGKLYVNGFSCDTLEPPPNHVMSDRCCIPADEYVLKLRYSPHHGYAVLGVLNVPGFSDVEIHPGNDVYDTKACILVGNSRGQVTVGGKRCDAVLNSRNTFDKFMKAVGILDYKKLLSWDAVRDYSLTHEIEFHMFIHDTQLTSTRDSNL